jgi:general secretion pathway protein A
MFLDYYNLIEQPFGMVPDPRFLYFNPVYREALASLWYGVKENRGFMALVAQPGMGKTTLLFQLLRRLRNSSVRTAFLFQTRCDSPDLFRYLLQDLDVHPAPDLASMHQQLNNVLVREARAGKQFVFVIDEAQNLSCSVLETVRLLSDFETPQGKLLQIILAGQPQLISTLVKPGMIQLRQRIAVTTSLNPLGPGEVVQYIGHRLGIAGYQGPPLFTRKAVDLIARESQGIPRNINNLCFGAMSVGFALRRTRIDDQIVEEVLADQNLNAIEMRVTEARARQISAEHREAPEVSARMARHRGGSPMQSSWLGRRLWRAACTAIVLVGVTTGLSLRMRPDLGTRLVQAPDTVGTPTTPAPEISAVAQKPSSTTTSEETRTIAVPRRGSKGWNGGGRSGRHAAPALTTPDTSPERGITALGK